MSGLQITFREGQEIGRLSLCWGIVYSGMLMQRAEKYLPCKLSGIQNPSPLQEWGSSDDEDRKHGDRWGTEPAAERWSAADPPADPPSERWTASPAPEDQPPVAGMFLLHLSVACTKSFLGRAVGEVLSRC